MISSYRFLHKELYLCLLLLGLIFVSYQSLDLLLLQLHI